MKKIFTTLAVFLSLALVACGGKTSEPEGESSVTPEQENCQHKYGKEKFNEVAATCTTEGSYQTKCEKCGYMKTTTVKALGHDFSVVMSDTATCTTAGVAVYKCSRCTETEEKASEAHHNFQPVEYTKGDGEVTSTIQKCSACNLVQIKWSAQDSAKQASGLNSEGKLSSKGDYVSYKFSTPYAMKARLICDCTFRTTQWYSRDASDEDKAKSQAVWYDYKESDPSPAPNWKYILYYDGDTVDQSEHSYTIGDEVIPVAELGFADFVKEGTESGLLPWVELDLTAGAHTLKIERQCGYTNYFVNIMLEGIPAAA